MTLDELRERIQALAEECAPDVPLAYFVLMTLFVALQDPEDLDSLGQVIDQWIEDYPDEDETARPLRRP